MIPGFITNLVYFSALLPERHPEELTMIKDILNNQGIKNTRRPSDPDYPDSAVGIYINFLEVGNLIVLPSFDHPDQVNQKVLDQFWEIYPYRQIEQIDCTALAKEGGILNCATWGCLKR